MTNQSPGHSALQDEGGMAVLASSVQLIGRLGAALMLKSWEKTYVKVFSAPAVAWTSLYLYI